MQIGTVGYSVCGLAFLLLTLLVAWSKPRTGHKRVMATACALTALWAGITAIGGAVELGPFLPAVSELARDLAWITFLLIIMNLGASSVGWWNRAALCAVALCTSALFVADIFADRLGDGDGLRDSLIILSGSARLILAVAGLLLLENLFRNSTSDDRWAVKYLCFGLGIIFIYDFYTYADLVLFRRIDQDLVMARGYVTTLAVVPLAVAMARSKSWQIGIHVSRDLVFHSAALFGAGIYLLVMSGTGFYLKNFGGEWGPIIQVVFLAGSIVLLLTIFSSGTARARFRIFIGKHFFSSKYDYRVEWQRFIRTVSAVDPSIGLHHRAVRAVADIVGSSAGGLWVLREEDGAYIVSASWNVEDLPAVPSDSELISFLGRTQWIVEIGEFKKHPGKYEGLSLPEWLLSHPRAWLIVPLIHQDTMSAFLVLGEPRARVSLGWEDFDLIKMIGRQVASYLAEERAATALSDARRLEAFHRRFAFVAHDIKNIVGQMALMLRNAERFGDNAEFQMDMFETIGNAVSRMRAILDKLGAEGKGDEDETGPVALRPLVAHMIEDVIKGNVDLEIGLKGPDISVAADEQSLISVVNHLLQNAIEAAGADGKISIRLRVVDDEAILEIEDNGPGMDAKYIKNQLFRPLASGKAKGYGIGAYQARQLVREMGGRLLVQSTPNRGTIMQVILPVLDPMPERSGDRIAAI